MPKIDGEAPISMAEMMAEIEGLKQGRTHHLALALTADQERVLLEARPGQPGGLSWPDFMRLWKRAGWAGSEGTLRKLMRKLVQDG